MFFTLIDIHNVIKKNLILYRNKIIYLKLACTAENKIKYLRFLRISYSIALRKQNKILQIFANFAFDCPELSLMILFRVAYYSFAKLLC